MERDSHPSACVRRWLLAIWTLHCELTREDAARVAGVAHSTVEREVSRFRTGRLEAQRTSGREYQLTSELAQHTDNIRQFLEAEPVRSAAEACHRIDATATKPTSQTHVTNRLLRSLEVKVKTQRLDPTHMLSDMAVMGRAWSGKDSREDAKFWC